MPMTYVQTPMIVTPGSIVINKKSSRVALDSIESHIHRYNEDQGVCHADHGERDANRHPLQYPPLFFTVLFPSAEMDVSIKIIIQFAKQILEYV
jgi:hypothetical protein